MQQSTVAGATCALGLGARSAGKSFIHIVFSVTQSIKIFAARDDFDAVAASPRPRVTASLGLRAKPALGIPYLRSES